MLLPVGGSSVARDTDYKLFGVTPDSIKSIQGYVDRRKLWRAMPIAVCWDQDGNEATKTLVRETVESSWGAVEGVAFTGWSKCVSRSAPGIHINLDEYGVPESRIGTALNGIAAGMLLSSYDKWMPGGCTDRLTCVRSTAIHEFGHALGFEHEHLHPDAPPACKALAEVAKDRPKGKPEQLTNYDPHSVMNYCNRLYYRALKLSRDDVATARAIVFAMRLGGPVLLDR